MQIKSLLIKAAVRCKDRTGQGYGGEQAGLLIGAVQGGTHNSPPVAAILYSAIAGIVIKPGHNDLIKKNTFFGIRQKSLSPSLEMRSAAFWSSQTSACPPAGTISPSREYFSGSFSSSVRKQPSREISDFPGLYNSTQSEYRPFASLPAEKLQLQISLMTTLGSFQRSLQPAAASARGAKNRIIFVNVVCSCQFPLMTFSECQI